MTNHHWGAIEAILMVAQHPVTVNTLAKALLLPEDAIEEALLTLAAEYHNSPWPRGVEVRHVGGGWRIYTRPEHYDAVASFLHSDHNAKLSRAAVETLAIIAYRQPVTRGHIAAIRGVNVDGVIRTLLARDLIEETGQDPATGAWQYRTTSYFLERMGLNSLDDLPPLAPHVPPLEAVTDREDIP